MDLATVSEVVAVRDRAGLRAAGFGPGDAYLAGGSWLFSEPQVGLERLIDLTALGWPGIVWPADGDLELAATCTLAEVAALEATPEAPALAVARACCEALRGSFKVWNVATVGGNLCCALPAAPMVALTAALGGQALVWTPGDRDGADDVGDAPPGANGHGKAGERRVLVADLVTGPGTTSLEPGELVRSIHLSAAALRCTTAFRQASLTHLGRSAALLIGRLDPVGGAFVLTITASTPRPVQLAFPTMPTAEALESTLREALPDLGAYFDDLHGSPAWRRQLTHHLAHEIRDELAA